MKKIIALFLVMLLIICMPSFAAENMSAKIDSEKAEVTVEGVFDNKKELMTIRILPKSVSPDSITAADIINNNYLLKTIRTDSSGKYGESIILPDNYSSDIYTVYVSCESKELKKDFTYINYSQIKKLTDALNLTTDEADFLSKFSDTDIAFPNKNYKLLVLSDEDYNAFGNDISKMLFYGMPAGGYKVDSFVSEYSKAYFINKQNRSFSEDRVFEYASYFNLDYDNEYKNISNSAKTYFEENLKKYYKNNKKTDEIFWDSLILARISASTNYVELKDIFLSYQNYLKPDMTKYQSLNEFNQSEVFSKVFSEKDTFDSIDKLNTSFKNVVDAFYSGLIIQVQGGGSSSGVSSGGGNYSGNFDINENPSSIGQNTQNTQNFNDMKNHWSLEYVNSLTKKGIINGFSDGSFKPDNKITRAELIKIIVEAFGIEKNNSDCFTDVKSQDWFYPYVGGAYKLGIAKGSNGKFNPTDAITRQDAASLIYRALGNKIKSSSSLDFSDSALVSDYAKEAVGSLNDAGILTGYNNMFNPLGNATRAEASAMICRTLNHLKGVQ